MPLSRLEKVATGLYVLGGLSLLGGDTASTHFKSQIEINVPVAQVRELDIKMGRVASMVHGTFYYRDPKGYDRPSAVFLQPENREPISYAWADYDKLRAEHEALVSQPGVRELMEKNRRLENSAMGSIAVGYGAGMLFGVAGVITNFINSISRSKRIYRSAAQTLPAQKEILQ